jgi:hypothetical protein
MIDGPFLVKPFSLCLEAWERLATCVNSAIREFFFNAKKLVVLSNALGT